MSLMHSIREEMQSLIVEGVLRPADVVDAARNPNSSMHGQFEWDDGEAAEQYRLYQARILIRRVQVEVIRPDNQVVHIPTFVRAGDGNGYLETQVAIGTPRHFRAAAITLSQVSTMLRNLGMPEADPIIEMVESLRIECLSQAQEPVEAGTASRG